MINGRWCPIHTTPKTNFSEEWNATLYNYDGTIKNMGNSLNKSKNGVVVRAQVAFDVFKFKIKMYLLQEPV